MKKWDKEVKYALLSFPMSVLTPQDGLRQYLDSLKGLRANLPGTPEDRLNQSCLSYQDLIKEIGRGKISVRYYPDDQSPPSTHIAKTRDGEIVHLILDADNCKIYLLVEESVRMYPKKNHVNMVTPEKIQIQKPQGMFRYLINLVLRRA